MCGIFGMFGEGGNKVLAQRVISALRHRGPDDHGFEQFDNGMMAHTRLSIIDLSLLGRQPMANTRQTVWIAYNGEIYNYLELRDQLSGYPFRTHTDTEVILAAYEAWGLEFLSRLRGMFAFGLWDAERRRLVLATDRFTIKPLYYHVEDRRLIFSSEIKPFQLAGIRLRPNVKTLYDYLALGLLDHTEETFFDGILQLRPGTRLIWEDGRVSMKRYWDLDVGEGCGEEEAVRQVEARLEEAIRLHLRGDVEIGLSLSSGLDSNVLRELVLRSIDGSKSLQCFTFAFPRTPYDEAQTAQRMSMNGRCSHHAIEVAPQTLLEGLRELVVQTEGPVGGLGIYGYWLNAKLASEHGIKVLLDGQGADEIFAGYRYYYELKLRQLWEQGEQARAREEFQQLRQAHGEDGGDFEALMAKPLDSSEVLAPDSTSLTSEYTHPEFVDGFAQRRHEFPKPFGCAVKNAMYKDLFFSKIPKLLRWQDKCAMAWSVEVRVPYLDHELVEALFRTPTPVLLGAGLTKSLLRRIGARHLSGEVLRVPKLYVAAPQREWLKTILREPIRGMIQESVLAERQYIVREKLLKQFDDYAESPELGNSFFVWKFMNLELLYRAFFS